MTREAVFCHPAHGNKHEAILHLFDLEVLEQTEKGLEKSNSLLNLLKIAVFNFTPIFGPHTPSSLKVYPYDTITVYDTSFWCMRLCHKSTIPARYSLVNVAICLEDLND